jgi:AbrB family looped-hinge helix DNA binding protein
MKWQATMTTRGRVTLPPDVRQRLGVKPGDRLEFEYEGNKVLVRRVAKPKQTPLAK